ncbi:MAG TPA: hypothetical protein VFL76_08345 [Edaphocola sp.]|nr:hypothetical protein [Edaphocola sp.]
MKFYFLLLGIIYCFGSPAMGQAQSPVSVSCSYGKMLIGDQINIWLSYKQANPNVPDLHWAKLPDSIPGLTWVEKGKIDTLKTKDSFILKQKLTLTGFEPGTYIIPSFIFSLTNKKGQQILLHTDSFKVQVQTIAVDTTKAFKPVKDVRQMRVNWLDHWQPITFGLVGLVILALLLLYLFKWRRKKQPAAATIPPEKAHERALRLLVELKAKKLWQSGEIKAYYEELSQIIRSYLENRFGVPSLERTTDELLRDTHKMAALKPFRKQLRMILQTADLAKFARATPLAEEHENCMQAAEELVIKTQMSTGEGGE